MVYFNPDCKFKQYIVSSHSAPSGTPIWDRNEYSFKKLYRYSNPEGQPKCRIRINVSGMIFETWLSDFSNHPTTLLGSVVLRQPFYSDERNEYFFDRHRGAFEGIFQYYKYGGRIKCPNNVPNDVFHEEMQFFKLEFDVINKYRQEQGYITEKIILPSNSIKRMIWMLFEYPETSGYAYAVGIISVLLITISITVFCLETIPSFPSTCVNNRYNFLNVFFICETICNIWFTLEVIGRIISCPDKKEYIRDCKNVIDIVALVPYFITLADILYSHNCIGGNKGGNKSGKSLALLRVIRLIRIFKLTKHSSGLQILIMTFQASFHGLGIFFMAMSVSMLVFSSIIYYIEVDVPDSQIESIPGAFWWCVITMCTVGYGDVVPKSPAGRVVGGICAVAGVLNLAMAVPIITENFNKFYSSKTGRGRH